MLHFTHPRFPRRRPAEMTGHIVYSRWRILPVARVMCGKNGTCFKSPRPLSVGGPQALQDHRDCLFFPGETTGEVGVSLAVVAALTIGTALVKLRWSSIWRAEMSPVLLLLLDDRGKDGRTFGSCSGLSEQILFHTSAVFATLAKIDIFSPPFLPARCDHKVTPNWKTKLTIDHNLTPTTRGHATTVRARIFLLLTIMLPRTSARLTGSFPCLGRNLCPQHGAGTARSRSSSH